MKSLNKTLNMKTNILILGAVVLSFFACENQDIEFSDYGTTAVYFPYQTPIRTLVRGNYPHGINDNDNANRFEVGVIMSGVYANTKDRKVYYKVDPTLLDGISSVEALPSTYYTIEGLDGNGEGVVTIPSGSIDGRIMVQLTDDFLSDPKSFAGVQNVNYVLPLMITRQEGCDTILSGLPFVNDGNAIRTKGVDWDIKPKDYSLFGIKFMNEYQGIYIIHGADEVTDAAGAKYTSTYHSSNIRNDRQVTLSTTGKSSVEYSNLIYREAGSPGNVNIVLSFNEDGKCTIGSFDGNFNVSGSGEFIEAGADSDLSEDKVDVMYLTYEYRDVANNEDHLVNDTLYILSRDVKFEQFSLESPESPESPE